jgi:exodeoxyribonuclease VII small subunit
MNRPDDGDGSAPSSRPEDAAQSASFEESLGELAGLVAKLESGSLGLSESIDGYERGVAILRRLHDELARAEERVSVLVRIDDEGRPVLTPHEDAATTPDKQPSARRTRSGGKPSSARSRPLPGMDEASEGA